MKRLIVYFSWSNNTKNLVEEINKEFDFDTVRIEREIPYSTDYNTCAYVEAKEEWDKKIYPKIKENHIDFTKYDKILLFFPIWWYTFPMPIATFISELKQYAGEVYLFANSYTKDPQYMINVITNAKTINPNIVFKEGLFNKSTDEHIQFIKEIR